MKKGYSLVEVMVASIILAITILAALSGIAYLKTPAIESDRRLQAAIYGQKVLDQLRGKVDAATWVDAGVYFTAGVHNNVETIVPFPAGSGITAATYTVVGGPTAGVKKVTVNVKYD